MKRFKRPVLAFLFSIVPFTTVISQLGQDEMIAHFINVGQGDATLIEFPCGAVLIDAGAQNESYERTLISYLEEFFHRRHDLNRTIDLVIVTHAHLDHNLALDNVANTFTIKRYIDNGLKVGSGSRNQNWLRNSARERHLTYSTYSFEDITKNGNNDGVTDTIIDPFVCSEVDPQIVLLSGRFTVKPNEWSKGAYNNGNNHSVVIKITFGKASFLFSGDLEKEGIDQLLKVYDSSKLDIDILRVGHHGSDNATTKEFLNAVTPTHAIISCGKWYSGRGSKGRFNTYSYGHPRIVVLDLLKNIIHDNRSTLITVKAAVKSKQFKNYTIMKRIYATPWDNTIQIEANSEGVYRVTRNH